MAGQTMTPNGRGAIRILVALCVVLACGRGALAETGPPAGPAKKIIGWGTDTLDAVQLSEHVEQLERLRSLDGVVVSLYPDDWTGSRRHRNRMWFGGTKYSREDFQEGVARLKGCRFARFTDNFIDFSTTAGGERLAEWFDENWMQTTGANVVLAAQIAREVGFKGLFIDTEAYGYGQGRWRSPFSYRTYAEECAKAGVEARSRDECKEQLRLRGRELAAAITKVYPGIVLYFIAGIGVSVEHPSQELVLPFVDGILDGAGPDVEIHDGGEQGYPRMLYVSFRKLREDAQAKGRGASVVPERFEERIRYGFGIWVDCRPEVYGGFHTDDLSRNHRDGPGFEHALYNALTVSDEYVWLYVWHPSLWWTPWRPREKMCPLCPHEEVPSPFLDAIVNCRRPHDLDWTPLRKDDKAYPPAGSWPGYDKDATFADLDKNYELVKDLSRETWQFHLDAELPFGYTGLNADESLFTPILIAEFWENQGHPYDGIGWYRLWVDIPETLNGRRLDDRKFLLAYGGVAGSTCTWIWRRQVGPEYGIKGYPHGHAGVQEQGEKWNYVELGRQNLDDYDQERMAQPFTRDVSMIVRPGLEHLFVVRVHNTKGPGGIWRPIRLYVQK